MRILVADQNALLLAAITATFGKHCDLVTASRREVCMEYAEQGQFDIVVACDKLADYTGLELLSEISEVSPGTLLIFAASHARLERLGHRLEAFGLFERLAYPITPRKLLNTLKAARAALTSRAERKVRHVVLESEWDTGEQLALVESELDWGPAEPAPGADWAVMPDRAPVGRVVPKAAAAAVAPVAAVAVAPAAAPKAAGVPRAAAGSMAAPTGSVATVVIEATAVPATTDRWEVSEHEGFVYEAAPAAIPVIEVMAPDAPIADAESTLDQVDYDDIGNDPVFELPEPTRWAEDGAANDIAFESKSAAPAGRGGGGQTLSATRTSGGSWSVNGAHGESTDGSELGSTGRQDNRPVRTAADVAAAWYASDTRGSVAPGACGPAAEAAASGGKAATGSQAAAGAKAAAASSTADSGAATAASGPEAERAASAKPDAKSTPRATDASAKTAKNSAQSQGRKPAAPTAAQRAAFERALARRNAERTGAVGTESGGARRRAEPATASMTRPVDTAAVGHMFAEPLSGVSANSLSSLARAATNKRPLAGSRGGIKKPKRAVFAVGSGLAAVILVAVVSFELLHGSQSEPHHRQMQVASTQFFSPQTTMLAGEASGAAPQLVAPPPDAIPDPLPQPETFDPDTAPPDPPPPPALEHPGPMEPPSEEQSEHTGPPLGMLGPEDSSQ